MMERFELDGKKKFNHLSLGMKTMVSTIICLASNKSVVLLDEPVLGFDAIMRVEFYDMLTESFQKHPRIIIVSTHIIPNTLLKKFNNILKLPGDVRPEEVIYNYIINLPETHPYWESSDKFGMNWTYFKENGPNAETYTQEKEREKYKQWFKDHKNVFDSTKLYEFWANDNGEKVNTFKNNSKEKYNGIASRTFAIKIKD